MTFVIRQALLGMVLLAQMLPGWACQLAPERAYPIPQCEPAQIVSGVCLNSDMKQAIQLTQSPDFKADFANKVQKASAYLATQSPASHKVVITDLDETLIDNSGYYQTIRVFDQKKWNHWIASHTRGHYFDAVRTLLRDAKKQGYSVMFITGRPVEQASSTMKQVKDIPWDGMFFRPQGLAFSSREYKAQVRQMLRQLGYTIVLNVGDQASDFDMPVNSAEGEFLLPNVLYSIP